MHEIRIGVEVTRQGSLRIRRTDAVDAIPLAARLRRMTQRRSSASNATAVAWHHSSRFALM
jgi:hypothetical protein